MFFPLDQVALPEKSFRLMMTIDRKARGWSFPRLQVAKSFSAHGDSMFTVSVYRFLVDQIANKDIAQGPCYGEPCSAPLIIKVQGDPVMKTLSHWPLGEAGGSLMDFKPFILWVF